MIGVLMQDIPASQVDAADFCRKAKGFLEEITKGNMSSCPSGHISTAYGYCWTCQRQYSKKVLVDFTISQLLDVVYYLEFSVYENQGYLVTFSLSKNGPIILINTSTGKLTCITDNENSSLILGEEVLTDFEKAIFDKCKMNYKKGGKI